MINTIKIFLFCVVVTHLSFSHSFESDHEKAIEAVKDGQILPLDEI